MEKNVTTEISQRPKKKLVFIIMFFTIQLYSDEQALCIVLGF